MQRRGQQPVMESAIPLILIAILAVFIAGRLNIINLSSVPGVGSLFPSPVIKVAVVGRASDELKNVMTTADFRENGISYIGDISPNTLTPGVLNQFDVIVLQGTQVCDREARRVLSEKVKAGGKMILIGDACTKVSEDPAACGWGVGLGLLGDVVPVQTCGTTNEKEPIKTFFSSGKLKIVQFDHPIFGQDASQKNFQFNGYLTDVTLKSSSKILAFVDEGGNRATNPARYAIVEGSGLVGGKVIYFGFDPGTTSRNMLLNTIIYLRGTRG
jgi:hypothetical protein